MHLYIIDIIFRFLYDNNCGTVNKHVLPIKCYYYYYYLFFVLSKNFHNSTTRISIYVPDGLYNI